jgi:hypothetical protein
VFNSLSLSLSLYNFLLPLPQGSLTGLTKLLLNNNQITRLGDKIGTNLSLSVSVSVLVTVSVVAKVRAEIRDTTPRIIPYAGQGRSIR